LTAECFNKNFFKHKATGIDGALKLVYVKYSGFK
jgi:hypothetical protein